MMGSDSRIVIFYQPSIHQPFADLSRGFKVTELLAAYKDRSFEGLHGNGPSFDDCNKCCESQPCWGAFSMFLLRDWHMKLMWLDVTWHDLMNFVFYFTSSAMGNASSVWRTAEAKQIRRTKEKTWSSWKRKTFQWGQGFSELASRKTHPWGFS